METLKDVEKGGGKEQTWQFGLNKKRELRKAQNGNMLKTSKATTSSDVTEEHSQKVSGFSAGYQVDATLRGQETCLNGTILRLTQLAKPH